MPADVYGMMDPESRDPRRRPSPGSEIIAILVTLAIVVIVEQVTSLKIASQAVACAKLAVGKFPLPMVWFGALALLIGYALYYLREVTHHAYYGPCEMVFGALLAGWSIYFQNYLGILSFLSGVRIVIDGIKRRKDLKAAREKKLAATAAAQPA